MGKAYRIKSLANTSEVYTVIQIRLKDGDIKVQGYGPKVNRDYGVSCVIDGSDCPELVEFLEKVASAVDTDTKLQVYELDYGEAYAANNGDISKAQEVLMERVDCSLEEATISVAKYLENNPKTAKETVNDTSELYGKSVWPLTAKEKGWAMGGEKIKAIKLFKDRVGCSLKEAKEAVEAFMDTL